MAPSKIRKALGAVKDQTSISIAKVSSSNSLCDLDVAIVKATRHEEHPADERYVREILSLTSHSRAYLNFGVDTLSRRLNKTKNWTVALKTLMLIHRLLSEGDPAYEQEIFFATRRGTRLLNMSDFRDKSQSGSWDFSAFVRTYARYLDEQLEFRMQARQGRRIATREDDRDREEEEEEVGMALTRRATPVRELTTERIFTRAQHLQQLLERFLACRPTGVAKFNRVVIVALYPVVKESFQIYYDITEIMGILIERFMQLGVPDCVMVHEIFTRIGKQFDELDTFYSWCRSEGIARSSEYPEVERIESKKLQVMDEFIRDKSALARNKRYVLNQQPKTEVVVEEKPQIVVEDMNEIKALPPPEGFCEVMVEEEKEEMIEEGAENNNNTQQEEADLLNLRDDAETGEEQGDRLALALFDGNVTTTTSSSSAWEAFKSEDSADWETALVQSASNLKNQKAALGGGFDTLILDGMYQQSAAMSMMGGAASSATGSASSVALGSAGKPAMLALPAPPIPGTGDGLAIAGTDPFAASLLVAPPTYVQISEMEKKQKLLVEEQLMWQQYARNGMQGHHRVQQKPFGM